MDACLKRLLVMSCYFCIFLGGYMFHLSSGLANEADASSKTPIITVENQQKDFFSELQRLREKEMPGVFKRFSSIKK